MSVRNGDRRLLGLISDTHGTLPSAIHEAFSDVSLIVHAGDIGGEGVLVQLEAIAPVVAVRGNTDPPVIGMYQLPEAASLRFEGLRILVTHDARSLDRTQSESVDVIVIGHTHRPEITSRNGIWRVNPGSASANRTAGGQPTAAILVPFAPPQIRIVSLA